LTQRDLGRLVSYSREWVTKVEHGERWPTEDFARRADLALDTGGVLLLGWPAVEAERVAARPSKQPRPLAKVLPLPHPHPRRTTPAAPFAVGDALAAMVVAALSACPGVRVVVFAMDAGAPGPVAATSADGDDGHAAVVELADYRPADARRRAGGIR
jgi:hypothetical protein